MAVIKGIHEAVGNNKMLIALVDSVFRLIFSCIPLISSSFYVPSGSIEVCLSHLLKRRAAGFLRSDKIAALFTKIGKVNTTASEICRKVQEQLQQQAEITRSDFLLCSNCARSH